MAKAEATFANSPGIDIGDPLNREETCLLRVPVLQGLQ